MRIQPLVLAPAIAAIAITVALAAGRSPAPRPGSGIPRKADVAEPRAPDVESPSDRPPEAAPLPIKDIPALLKSRNPAERGRGLRALGSLASRAERIAALRETLNGADTGTKSRALSLLKAVGGADAVSLAAGVLRADGPSWLRAQAASVLGDLGDASALAPLLDVSRGEDLQVRAGAVAALDQLGHAAPLRELIGTLAEMLDHPDGRKREEAVDLLSTFRTPAVFPALAVALGDRTNSRIREAAADALGQSRRAEAAPYLEGALGDAEPGVREAARRGLDAIRDAARTP
ncbi:MAG TPA: HEAT repeat domain-containing protein [Planctomycetota bacterium]